MDKAAVSWMQPVFDRAVVRLPHKLVVMGISN
jgi:hypothetical protein